MKNSLVFLELKRKVTLKAAILEYKPLQHSQHAFLQKVKYYRGAREKESVGFLW